MSATACTTLFRVMALFLQRFFLQRFSLRRFALIPTLALLSAFSLPLLAQVQNCADRSLLEYFGKNRLMLGATIDPNITGASQFFANNRALLDVNYMYIADGLPLPNSTCYAGNFSNCSVTSWGVTYNCTSSNNCRWWGLWNQPPGSYVTNFLNRVEGNGHVPMISYYIFPMAFNSEGSLAPANDTSQLKRYFDDWRFMLQQIGNRKVLLHMEPDLWGFAMQENGTPQNIPAKVKEANSTDCGSLDNNLTGFSKCLIHMVRKYAPGAKVGLHASAWAVGGDINTNTNPNLNIPLYAARQGDYLNALGAQDTDFLVVETLARDADYIRLVLKEWCPSNNPSCSWWDTSNKTLPNFDQHFRWVTELNKVVKKPLVWWQMPLGNLDLPNQYQKYKDNRVDYFLQPAIMDKIVEMGGVLVAFGAGEINNTNPLTDGGNFVNRAAQYKQSTAGYGYCGTGSVSPVQPAITSANNTAVVSGTGGTFQVTATGTAPISYSLTGAPTGVTINSNGLINIAATTAVGSHTFTIRASNAAPTAATMNFTLRVNAATVPPSITSANNTTVTSGTASTFQVTTTGTTPISYSLTGTVPNGVTINSNIGLISIAATTAVGNHTFTIRASNAAPTATTMNFTLRVNAATVAPSITSASSTTVTSGTASTFQVVATGTTPISYSLTGTVPNGVTINSNTGLISIAATTAVGNHTFTIRASNAASTAATMRFTLTVNVPPSITSANSMAVVSGTASAFTVTASGTAPISYSLTGAPAGVTINSSTGVISIAATTAVGSHTFTITASNNASPAATMKFTLTVNAAPVPPGITSANNTAVVSGTGGTFTVTTTGTTPISYSLTGAPAGVTINSTTGVISIAATTAVGSHAFTITASNNASPAATMRFTLTVNAAPVPPSITSANNTAVTSGAGDTFTVTTTGTTPISYSLTGAPTGVVINSTTGVISVAATTAVGSHAFTITASNAASSNATMPFTLTVTPAASPPSVITSANNMSVVSGMGGTFQVTASGDPGKFAFSLSGQPAGVSIDEASGLITIAGNLAAETYQFTITASNNVSSAATMNFTLTVKPNDPTINNGSKNPDNSGNKNPSCGIGNATNDRIQKAYIAFFNRPADVPGLNHWKSYPGNAQDMLTEFSKSAEYLSDYAGLSNRLIISKVYKNLFGRAPETKGLNYWSQQMDAGWVTVANVAHEILGGAQNEDATIITNKVCASNMFTDALQETQEIEAYNNAGPIGLANAAKDWLALVNEQDKSIEEAYATLDTLVNRLVTKWSNGF